MPTGKSDRVFQLRLLLPRYVQGFVKLTKINKQSAQNQKIAKVMQGDFKLYAILSQ